MELADHFRTIAANWWRIALVSLLVAAGVYAASSQQADTFRASTFLGVEPGRAVNVGVASQDDSVFLAATYAELANTKPLIRRAVNAAELDVSVSTAQERVETLASGDLGFVTVEAKAPLAVDASRLANAVAEELIRTVQVQQQNALDEELESVNTEIASLQAQLRSLPTGAPERADVEARYSALLQAAIDRRTQPRNRVEIVAPATPPDQPVAPRPKRDALLAFLVAIVATSELTVLLRAVSDRFSSRVDVDEIARYTGLPVLALIPRGSDEDVVESFRILRSALTIANRANAPRTIAVVSSEPGEGKSFVAIHLAESASRAETRVVLVDADLRRPVIHERLGVPLEPGLSDILGGLDPQRTLRHVARGAIRFRAGAGTRPSESVAQFDVIPSGAPVGDPPSALGSPAFVALLDRLDAPGSLVVIDTPPATLFADAPTIAINCDAALLVVDAKSSHRRAIRRSIRSFEQVGAQITGVVVNRTRPTRASYYERRGRRFRLRIR